MPTYDYQCRDCGTTIEVIHPMLDDGPEACGRCGGPLRRILYPTGIIFRGSGFYKTDSRSPAPASTEGKGGEGSAESSTRDRSSQAAASAESGAPGGTGGASGPGSSAAGGPSAGGSESGEAG